MPLEVNLTLPSDNPIGSPHETRSGSVQVNAGAVEKALTILMLLIESNRDLGTVEVSRRTGFHKATASRILFILAKSGLIAQNDLTRKYTAGLQSYRLSIGLLQRDILAIAERAAPVLADLHTRSGATISLELWTGKGTVTCHAEPIARRSACDARGQVLPLHAIAGTKAILAHLDPTRVEHLLPSALPAYTSRTVSCRLRLLAELKQIGKEGYTVEIEGQRRGFSVVAVPLLDENGCPLAAISAELASGEAAAINMARMVEMMRTVSDRLVESISRLASPSLFAWHYGHD